MMVKDTLQIDSIRSTLRQRLREFVAETPCLYVNDADAVNALCHYFSYWQYNGAAPFDEIMLWCEEHFGRDWIWRFETIFFKHERDRTVFLLKWA
jgi:hypothetical protein